MFQNADSPVEKEVTKIVKSKQKFERMIITKEEGLELFADNPFKVEILKTKVPDGSRTTVYKCGDLIDLCRGPHVAHTGKVKAFAAIRHSAASWLGDTDNDPLQRMYGISFPDKKMLKVWKENQEKVRIFVQLFRPCCLLIGTTPHLWSFVIYYPILFTLKSPGRTIETGW